MNLRGYVDRSPVLLRSKPEAWPVCYIDSPANQIIILRRKYKYLEYGRILLPKNTQQLWAQHKYSVMARDISAYKSIGKWVTSKTGIKELSSVALELTMLLRKPPEPRLIENTLLHMWGYVSKNSTMSGKEFDSLSKKSLLGRIQKLAVDNDVKYLTESTSLSELGAWSI